MQIARGRLIILRRTQPQYLRSFRVDEVFCHIANGAGVKLKEYVEQLTYADLPSILPPGRSAVHQKASSSQAKIYRVKHDTCTGTLGGSW